MDASTFQIATLAIATAAFALNLGSVTYWLGSRGRQVDEHERRHNTAEPQIHQLLSDVATLNGACRSNHN